MYERLLDKRNQPTPEFVRSYLGERSYGLLAKFEEVLADAYELTKDMKFPFGNNYGWGYKYSHKASHLCYTFFEAGAFTVMLQLGDNSVQKVDNIFAELLPKTHDLWENRYPCGDKGGWVHYRVLEENELNDCIRLLKIKKKPIIKRYEK